MAMPTKEKTWQYNVNQVIGAGQKPALLLMKNTLKGFGSSPWTVWGSCNAILYGNNDGVDRWTTTSDLNWVGEAGSTTRSWTVLKQTGLGADAAICYEMSTNSATQAITLVLFPTGPSVNGTTLVRPSASDEVVLLSGGYIGSSSSVASTLHAMQSTDGQCTRMVLCRLNFATGLYMFDQPKSPTVGWSPAVFALVSTINTSTNMLTYALLNDVAAAKGRVGAVASSFYLASEGWGASTLGEQMTFPDDDTAEYPLSPAYLASDTVGIRGAVKGCAYDLWWGSTALANGSTFPGDGSKTLVQFAHLVFPWNGSTPLIS